LREATDATAVGAALAPKEMRDLAAITAAEAVAEVSADSKRRLEIEAEAAAVPWVEAALIDLERGVTSVTAAAEVVASMKRRSLILLDVVAVAATDAPAFSRR
jgi:hypothetical protein